MATTTKWTPNEIQTKFLNALKADGPMTLAEFSEKIGKEVASGSVNTLIVKQIVTTSDSEIECLVVRKDNPSRVVGRMKKKAKIYSLVDKPATEPVAE